MRKRPIEKAHRAWSNQCTDRDRDRAVFVQNENRGEKIFRTFGHQATLTAQHANVPVEEFIHSSGKMIKFVALSLEKLREVVGEFVKKKIPYHFVDEWGLWLSDDETRKVLEPEKKEKTQIPAQRPRVEKTQTTAQPTVRKLNTAIEQAFDAWQREHKKDRPDYPRVVFVLREGPHGKYFQTYKDDAFNAAWAVGEQARSVDGIEFFNRSASNIYNVVDRLQKKGFAVSIIDHKGKAVALPPRPIRTTAPMQVPETGIHSKVWYHGGKYYMNAIVDGRNLPVREISIEEFKAFKKGDLSDKQLVGKHYSSEDMKPPQENISRGRGRG